MVSSDLLVTVGLEKYRLPEAAFFKNTFSNISFTHGLWRHFTLLGCQLRPAFSRPSLNTLMLLFMGLVTLELSLHLLSFPFPWRLEAAWKRHVLAVIEGNIWNIRTQGPDVFDE